MILKFLWTGILPVLDTHNSSVEWIQSFIIHLVSGLINKVNLTEWKEDSLKTNSNETQIVTGDLTVETLDLLGPVEGKIFFNGFNATLLVAEVEEKTANMTDIQKQNMVFKLLTQQI